jgi:TatD DNase family protein
LPLERLLTETDGPFTKVEGRVARPRDVGWTVGALAQARRADPDVIAAAIAANLRILVSGDAQ